MKSHVAYIDDDPSHLELLGYILKDEFELQTFQNGNDFLAAYPVNNFSAILLDIHMPTMDGFTLCESIMSHPRYNGSPIIFISSDDSDVSRIRSYSIGAIDFLGREISPDEILARLKSKILFYQKHRTIIEFGNLRVNLTLLKTYIDDKEIPLTFIEFKFLSMVLRNYPELISKQQIVDYVWNGGVVLEPTIYTHVSNLNGKLDAWDHEINGVKTKGIQLVKKAR